LGSVLLRDPWGRHLLRYGGLRVRDATGRELESRLVPAPGRIEIRFRDEGAAYPVDVDPLVGVAVWNAEINQESAQFGITVSTAGDVNGDGLSDILVGAPDFDAFLQQEGRAYLFLASPSGMDSGPSWSDGGDEQFVARFGTSVGTAGDVNGDGFDDVVDGASQYDGDLFNEGGVFLFLGSDTGLAAAPASIVEGNQVAAQLGTSVGTAGDVNGDGFDDVIAGAPAWDGGEFNEGRAVVYLGNSFGLAENPVWSAESNQNNAGFGTTVGTAGDVNGDSFSDVIVGAPFFNTAVADAGKAFVYHGSFAGPRTTAAWTAESGQAGAWFGSGVGTAGDANGDGIADVVVGAESYDLTAGGNQGRIYVYFGSERGLPTSPGFVAGIPDQAGGGFGSAVGTAGDVNGDGFSDILVGAPLWDNGETDEGRAFIYLGTPGGLA
ncbi:MAG: integrin alpha, partial [Actinomycetota bacterium]